MAEMFVVLLDGVKQLRVVTASEEEDWIELYEEGDIVRKSGRVEVYLRPQAGRFVTPNFIRVADWLDRAEKKVGDPQALSVQIGCMLEEVWEFIEQLDLTPAMAGSDKDYWLWRLKGLATDLKSGNTKAECPEAIKALDALCDIDITVNGVAYLAGWNKLAADLLVLNSNDDKFVDGKPVILPGGKIGKRPGWVGPDLKGCV